ncbi:MAG: hypothetical protein H0X69_04940 [Gemmatimonadales bacterium]|nr:hypothetical protein [Gemmatimonadales bacterium]
MPQAEVHSTGGRRLQASSGLVPDVVLGQDTLTTLEATFARSLGEQVPVFRDVLTAYALELREGKVIAAEQFEVTPGMRAEVQRRLRDRGVAVEDSVFGGAARLVAEQLGFEIARYTFGPAAERRRRAAGDAQIQRAIELARGTTSPQALLGLADPPAAQLH